MTKKHTRKKEVEMIGPQSGALAVRRKEAARMLSVSLTTLDRAISRGDLVAKKYGARTLVPRIEIDRYLDRMANKEKPPAT
jgi:excisionase family DNA binding protein